MEYSAQWSVGLVAISSLATLALLGCAALASTRRRLKPLVRAGVAAVPLAIIALCLNAMVRGYVLEGDVLYVERLYAQTPIEISDLVIAEYAPEKIEQSTRIWGNGGLYAYTGLYRGGTIGEFKAFVTDWDNAVIVRLSDRLFVLSPSEPEVFVADLMRAAGLADD